MIAKMRGLTIAHRQKAIQIYIENTFQKFDQGRFRQIPDNAKDRSSYNTIDRHLNGFCSDMTKPSKSRSYILKSHIQYWRTIDETNQFQVPRYIVTLQRKGFL